MNSVVRFWLVLLLTFCSIAPALAADEDVVPLGPGVTPPHVTKQVNPVHPAKGFRISGTVLLSVIVSSQGEAKEPRVLRSLEKDIDQSAIEAVLKWQFTPGSKDGKPVATRVSIEIRFHDM
ncbi:MAG: TonB family protein [Bryobacterales bacterium]|nr:TonB family protein [Bryobacterales bacterium]